MSPQFSEVGTVKLLSPIYACFLVLQMNELRIQLSEFLEGWRQIRICHAGSECLNVCSM